MLQALTNFQIDDYYKNESRYEGCFSTDQLRKLYGQRKFYILNLDSSKGPGTHFVLLYMCDKDVGIFYDSFGLPPDERILRYMKHYRKHNVRNLGEVQDPDSEACGWYAIMIADMLLKGKSFVDTVALFDTRGDLKKNETILKQYFFGKKK